VRRFIIDGDILPGNVYLLNAEESHHATRVLRLSVGDEIGIINGQGTAATAAISSISGASVQVIIHALDEPNEPVIDVTLYQGLCKGDKLELVAQKCTELGVCRIVPVEFARSDVRIGKDESGRISRLARIAREAAKQCGRAFIPVVSKSVSFEEMIHELVNKEQQHVIIPWEKDTHRLMDALSVMTKHNCYSIVIGPEGGIEQNEIDWLVDIGATPVSLGKRILRTETAAIAAVSILMYTRGEM